MSQVHSVTHVPVHSIFRASLVQTACGALHCIPGREPVYKFEMSNGEPYALAGLFSEWRPRPGNHHPPVDTFSILTTEANELMQPIHSRMPVILHARDYDRRLNDYDEARPPIDLLRPYQSEGMRMTMANRLVGDVRNNVPEMLNSA